MEGEFTFGGCGVSGLWTRDFDEFRALRMGFPSAWKLKRSSLARCFTTDCTREAWDPQIPKP